MTCKSRPFKEILYTSDVFGGTDKKVILTIEKPPRDQSIIFDFKKVPPIFRYLNEKGIAEQRILTYFSLSPEKYRSDNYQYFDFSYKPESRIINLDVLADGGHTGVLVPIDITFTQKEARKVIESIKEALKIIYKKMKEDGYEL